MTHCIVWLLAILFAFNAAIVKAQFAPPVGQAGTTAMYKDSSAFIDWANAGRVVRGYQDISNSGAGYASVGDSSDAFGPAGNNGVVSLGDGGYAILQFSPPIKDGPGNDLAVFENSFDDNFLELAFVEVSSDGIHYFRFPAVSNTDTITQTISFGYTDATKLYNLAGKYRGLYGTPFDLQEIADDPLLDKQAITHVKIIDVVGSIQNQYCSRDKYNHKVNDPWPTAFASGGFDLDAVGVIHHQTSVGIKETPGIYASVYPNPFANCIQINIPQTEEVSFSLSTYSGDIIIEGKFNSNHFIINTEGQPAGIYLLTLKTSGFITQRKVIKY